MYRNVRILVAEDSADDAFLLKRAFLKAGINAPMQIVGGGDDAMSYLCGGKPFENREQFPLPNLLLLDLKMPRTDGFAVLKWVREQPGLGRIPVVILSSSDDMKDVNLAHELGANGYAVKPTCTDDYVNTVRGIEDFWLKLHKFPTLEANDMVGGRSKEV